MLNWNWRKLIPSLVLTAVSIVFFGIIPRIVESQREDDKRDFMMHMNLVVYCDDHIGDGNFRTYDTGACPEWADEFLQEHREITRQCDDLEELRPFIACIDKAGAQQYLPSE